MRRCRSTMKLEPDDHEHRCELDEGHATSKDREPENMREHYAHLAANVVLLWVGAPKKIYGGLWPRIDEEEK